MIFHLSICTNSELPKELVLAIILQRNPLMSAVADNISISVIKVIMLSYIVITIGFVSCLEDLSLDRLFKFEFSLRIPVGLDQHGIEG
jgi:hypothetical protein